MQVKLYRGTWHPLVHVSKSIVDCFNFDTGLHTPTSGAPNCQMWETKLSMSILIICNLSFLLGGNSHKARHKFTRSKTIRADFMKLCALTFHNWLKLHVENTNVEKNYRSPSLSLLQIRKFIPVIWVADNVSLLNRQFDFPVAQDQRFCHKIVSYHKIFHIANHRSTPISISHTASSCCWAHVNKNIPVHLYMYIYIYIQYIINDLSYPNPHIQSIVNNPWEKKTHQETPVKGVSP